MQSLYTYDVWCALLLVPCSCTTRILSRRWRISGTGSYP